MTTPSIPYSLDDLLSLSTLGSLKRAQTNNLYGINQSSGASTIRWNKDNQGLTFLVRPQLNLMKDNIRNVRKLYTLLGSNEMSIPSFVRNTLDPRLAIGVHDGYGNLADKTHCKLVDPHMAFIPVLTNDITAVSGWPEPAQSTFISKPGVYQESWGQVDGNLEIFHDYDIDLTFRNTEGNPIILLFYIWMLYDDYVFKGKLLPYPDFIVENEIDYCTRIYRITLDETRRYVVSIAAPGACFPISSSITQLFDYSHDKPYNDQNRELTVRFKCFGAQYFDPILVKEFNETVCIFNASMSDGSYEDINKTNGKDINGPRVTQMTQIPFSYLQYFKNRGYPRINPDTLELEYWIDNNYYKNRLAAIINSGITQVTAISKPTDESTFPRTT